MGHLYGPQTEILNREWPSKVTQVSLQDGLRTKLVGHLGHQPAAEGPAMLMKV